MSITRRDFVKGYVAACTLLLPGAALATKYVSGNTTLNTEVDSRVRKSIKACFGGGFKVQSHSQSAGLAYANIEHLGNRYTVTSSNLLDWKIVSSI